MMTPDICHDLQHSPGARPAVSVQVSSNGGGSGAGSAPELHSARNSSGESTGAAAEREECTSAASKGGMVRCWKVVPHHERRLAANARRATQVWCIWWWREEKMMHLAAPWRCGSGSSSGRAIVHAVKLSFRFPPHLQLLSHSYVWLQIMEMM